MIARPTRVVRWLAAASCRIFYRIDRIGAPPSDGAVLLLPNHPNALLDPALVWATAGRDVRFLAKSTLFAGPLGPLLRAARAIPVYRRIDPGVDPSRNEEMFRAVSEAFAAGDAVCIFPEGVSHSSGRLETLRTGAARMALDAGRKGVSVALVPVGLNFDRKTAFRSRVTVVYGAPFSCRDLVPASDAGFSEAVRTLTARMAERIRALLVEADPDSDAALVDRVDRLYAAARGRPTDPRERLERRRIIAAGIERLRASDPVRYGELLLRLRRYDQRLRRFGLRDRHLDWGVELHTAVRFAVREAVIAGLLGPIAIAGLIVFFIPYQLTGLAARLTARDRDVRATAQVIAGAIIYGAWIAFLCTLAWQFAGRPAAIATALVLPALAPAALAAFEREAAVLDTVGAWLQLRRARPSTRDRLKRRRSEMADVLDQVKEWLDSDAARGI